MDIEEDKIEDAALALLWLTLHDGRRAWKNLDWDTMERLHVKGMIENPVNKSKSVVLTEEGLRRAEELFYVLFKRATQLRRPRQVADFGPVMFEVEAKLPVRPTSPER